MGDSVGAIIETPLELGQIFEDWNRKVSAKNAKPGTDTAALFFTISKVGESIDVVEALGNRTADVRAHFTTDVPLSPETIKSLGKERMLYMVLRASAKAALAWKSVEHSSPLYWDFYDLERDLTAMIVVLDEITFLQLKRAQAELKTRPDACRYFCGRKYQEKYNALISRHPTESPSLAPTTPAPTTAAPTPALYTTWHAGGCPSGYLGESGIVSDLSACQALCSATAACSFAAFCPSGTTGCTGVHANKCVMYSKCTSACDWQCYLNHYGDLQDAFGATNVAGAETHWSNHGKGEGRLCTCLGYTTYAKTQAAVRYIEVPGGGQCYNSGGWLPNFEQNGHTLATCQAKCTQFTDCVTVSLFTSGRCYGRFRSQSACIAAASSEGATNP